MDKHIDLTDDGAFSQRRIHEVLVKGRMPWDVWVPSSWISQALKKCFYDTTVCERCGIDIVEMPWDKYYGLCRQCEKLVNDLTNDLIDDPKRLPWKDPNIKDGYRDVFLTEFMDIRRNHQ